MACRSGGRVCSSAVEVLNERIPAAYRLASNTWYGLSSRARVMVVDKLKVKPGEITSYEDLADPKWKGQVCTRSGSHVYMLSLISSIIEHAGAEKAEAWAKGVVANPARQPKGGDTDQVKAVAAGECAVALSNSYYLARMIKSDKADDRTAMERVRVVWPNTNGRGVHMNVSGGGVLRYAPNRDNAIKFMEYLVSDEAQGYFANGNNEWPIVPSLKVKNAALESMGTFKPDPINMIALGKNQRLAQRSSIAWAGSRAPAIGQRLPSAVQCSAWRQSLTVAAVGPNTSARSQENSAARQPKYGLMFLRQIHRRFCAAGRPPRPAI